ncbi:MAG: hypothetical protein ACLSDQ_07685 [Adlercreutzia equolifaciens]
MTSYDFAISGQHYLFRRAVFAHTILAAGGDAFSYALFGPHDPGRHRRGLRGRRAGRHHADASETESALNEALAEAGLAFHGWPSPRRSWPCRQATPS